MFAPPRSMRAQEHGTKAVLSSTSIHAVPEADLPVELPEMEEFKPSGNPESPLVNATEWLRTTDPRSGAPARRDTNTMPQWAGSCWYFLRFVDPENGKACAPSLCCFHCPMLAKSRTFCCPVSSPRVQALCLSSIAPARHDH